MKRRFLVASVAVFVVCAIFVRLKRDDLLLVASGSGDPLVVRALLAMGANPSVQDSCRLNALMFAALQDDTGTAAQLLRHGADMEAGDVRGMTPVFYAGNRTKILSLLLEHGANPNARSIAGETPLMCAARYNLPDIATLLVAHGANVDTPDDGGRTPVMVTAYEGHEEIFQLLVSHGANLRAVDHRGWTALKCAQARRKLKIARYLEQRLGAKK